MYREIVFIHVLASIIFFMAHGASAAMAFRLRHEKSLERIRALLDLSRAAVPVAYYALMSLVLAGIAAGLMGNWFSQGWIWASMALLVFLWFGMVGYAVRFYTPVRKAVGLPYRNHSGEQPAGEPASAEEIAALIQASRPALLAGSSFILIVIILWLMMFKPF